MSIFKAKKTSLDKFFKNRVIEIPFSDDIGIKKSKQQDL